MERGLLWLPLLAGFIGLAWAGWHEWRKVDAYQRWAEGFDQSKYDIYAVLGQKEDQITWGKPTRQGVINPESISLRDLVGITLQVGDDHVDRPVDWDNPPSKGKPYLILKPQGDRPPIAIPFTEIPLAAQWGKYLERLRVSLH